MDWHPSKLRSAELQGDLIRVVWSDGDDAQFAKASLAENAKASKDGLGGHRIRTVRDLAMVRGSD